MSKEQFDGLVSKWISRKLLVFLIATIGLFTKFINENNWVLISLVYIGTETSITIVERYLKARING